MTNDQSLIQTEQLRKTIRKDIRRKRNSLTPEQQMHAGEQLCNQIKPFLMANKVAALYLDNDGEVSSLPTIAHCQQNQVVTLLPVMHSFKKGYLNFQRYDVNTQMVENNFAILEPKLNAQNTYSLSQIDYIFMPLVAFDEQGNRLGMGGGFYDRTLSKIHTLEHKPKLIGLAHDCQMLSELPQQSWDIPLDLIITPTKIITPKY
jgi:5-formyltetrahydrofolate cyclo-ligase